MNRSLFVGALFIFCINIGFAKSILYRVDDRYSVFILDISLFSQSTNLELWGTNQKGKSRKMTSFSFPKLTVEQTKKIFNLLKNTELREIKDVWSNLKTTKQLQNLGMNSSLIQFLFSNKFQFSKDISSFQIKDKTTKMIFDSGDPTKINVQVLNNKILFDLQSKLSGVFLKWEPEASSHLTKISINKIFGSDTKEYNIFKYSILNKKQKNKGFFLDPSVSEGKQYTYLLQNTLKGNIELPVLKKAIRYFVKSDILVSPRILELRQEEQNLFISWEQKNAPRIKSFSVFTSVGNKEFKEVYSSILQSDRDYVIELDEWDTYYRVYLLARGIDGLVKKSITRGIRVHKLPLREQIDIISSFFEGAVILDWNPIQLKPYHDFKNIILFKGLSKNRLFFFKQLNKKDISYKDIQFQNNSTYFYQLKLQNSKGIFRDISTITEVPILFEELPEKPLFLFSNVSTGVHNLKRSHKIQLTWKIADIKKIQELRLERINLTDQLENKKNISLERNKTEYTDIENIKLKNRYRFSLFTISSTALESLPASVEVQIEYATPPEIKNINLILNEKKELAASITWKFPSNDKNTFINIYYRNLKQNSSFVKLNKKKILAKDLYYNFYLSKIGRYEFYLQVSTLKIKKVFRSSILRFTF